MREWPSDLDVKTVFVEKELEMICFALSSIYLHFPDKLLLTVMSDFVYSSSQITEEISFPIRSTYLISSIGSKIIKAELIDKKDLCLWFEDGAKIEINGSTRMYECYSVNFKGREFYV